MNRIGDKFIGCWFNSIQFSKKTNGKKTKEEQLESINLNPNSFKNLGESRYKTCKYSFTVTLLI